MWKALIIACGLLDNQPMFCTKGISENDFKDKAVCERQLEDAKIEVATRITMMGLSPQVKGICICQGCQDG